MNVCLSIILVLFFAILGTTDAEAKSYREPLLKTEVPLIHKDSLLRRKDGQVMLLRCAGNTDTEPLVLAHCPVYQVVLQSEGNIKESEISLGQFDKIYFADFLANVGGAYNPNFRVGPLALGTLYGFLAGGFYGGLPGAIAGGAVGLTVDLIKLPVALIYTLGSYSHRQLQQERLLVRLNDLQFNRSYRPTRIVARKHFMQMVNSVTEYLDHFRLVPKANN